MLYMLSCIVLMITALHQMLQIAHAQLTRLGDSTGLRPTLALMLFWVSITAGFSSPFFVTMIDSVRMETVGLAPSHSIRWTIYVLLLAACATSVCAALTLRTAIKSKSGNFWLQGKAVALACAGGIGFVSAVSHLMFFQSSMDGIANVELIREMSSVKDMGNCRSGVAFVRYRKDDGPLTYRCPTTIMLGGYTSQPFAPWPDYSQGESQDLATAIRDLSVAAHKP